METAKLEKLRLNSIYLESQEGQLVKMLVIKKLKFQRIPRKILKGKKVIRKRKVMKKTKKKIKMRAKKIKMDQIRAEK